MIELTEQQRHALATSGDEPLTLVDPTTQTTYVLIRKDRYDLLTDAEYDDSPWTDEEMELLAWEAGQLAGWDDMDEYDHYGEKP